MPLEEGRLKTGLCQAPTPQAHSPGEAQRREGHWGRGWGWAVSLLRAARHPRRAGPHLPPTLMKGHQKAFCVQLSPSPTCPLACLPCPHQEPDGVGEIGLGTGR